MSTPLRALLVEDNPLDAELIVRKLTREGFALSWQRVDNEADFRRALEQPFDLVLCDYALPSFSGLSALSILRTSKPEVPLILVSGTIGEDVAVNAIQAGAIDYLLKDRLQRLGGAVLRALEQGRLLREHKRARAALELSEQRFRQLTEYIAEVFWIADARSRRLLYVSPAFERIWGKPAATSGEDEWPLSVHPEDAARAVQSSLLAREAGSSEQEYRILRPDGAVRVIRDRAFAVRDPAGEVVRLVGVADDITQARELEEQFRHAQKMEAIGQLAGGVAHDFNNLLSVIIASCSLLITDHAHQQGIAAGLEAIQLASERAAALTRQLLVFSRRETIQALDLDLNELVANVSTLLVRVLGEDVNLCLKLAPCALPLHADGGMIEQVVMNLAVNARDAMPDGGQLTIETQLVEQRALPRNLIDTLKSERHALLRVTDTGCGIQPELQSRIFEPFFTTKPQGKGTGLGLATLYSIVRRHHGAVELTSQPGEGASFSVYLPCSEQRAELTDRMSKAPSANGRGETILLVEDDHAVRAVTAKILTRYGYKVLQADNGARALDLWREHASDIRLLFTDMVMPGGISGSELARRLLSERSGLKVVYTSGYSDDIAGRELAVHERFLAKPFTPKRLADVVRACLDAA